MTAEPSRRAPIGSGATTAPRPRPTAPPLVNPPSPAPHAGTVAVVLAAGLGTRMRSALPKVLHPLCGRPMLAYVLDAWASTADGAAGGRPVVVFSPAVAAIIDAFADRADFALQAEPRGTGDALARRAGRRARRRRPRSSCCRATCRW